MKKYLASLIPFIYGAKSPKDFPDPSYPYQTKGTLAYLSTQLSGITTEIRKEIYD